MRASHKNNKQSAWFPHYPDSVRLQQLLINSGKEVIRIPDVYICVGLIKCPGEEESQEHQNIYSQITINQRPDNAPPFFFEPCKGWFPLRCLCRDSWGSFCLTFAGKCL